MSPAVAEGPDLVVVGAGGGMLAALRGASLGLSVLVIERDEHFGHGNNTSMSTAMIPGAGTHWQREAGIDDSATTFLADIMAKTKGQADAQVAGALAGVSARMVEWLAAEAGIPLSLVTDFPYPGHSELRCHSIPGRSGRDFLAGLVRQARRAPSIDLMTPGRLVEIGTDEAGVNSVVVDAPSGRERIPTRTVLLATNGFGANRDLVEQHIPEIAGATYHGSAGSTGDALRLGRDLGAQTAFLDAYQGHAALSAAGATLVGWATVMHGGVLVDRAGNRFGDETAGYSEYAARVLEHASGEAWIVLDERIKQACLAFKDFRDTVESGVLRSARDLEGLARSCGIDPYGLASTMAHVRESVEEGAEDPWGRLSWGTALASPYYAVAVQPALFHTQGGLVVDEHARVLSATGPIDGLYASGGAAAGISGHGASGYLAGNGLLPALGLAFLCAEHVAGWQT